MTDLARSCPSCSSSVPLGARSCPSCGALSLPASGSGSSDDIRDRLVRALGQRYRIEREIGRGGMAVVFLAYDLRHNRQVALKVLHPDLSPYLGDERFLREIRIAAQLSHPHIVPLHDSGEADQLLYYVMPYIEGDSLRQRLLHNGPLPVTDAVRMALEVSDGLACAHRLGVVHRDIKPENILFAHGHATIADFGIARAVYATSTGIIRTTGGISLGTPQYMSPEQATSDASVDARTDIYALGCTLYEALTGRPPYPGPDAMAFIAQHMQAPIPSMRSVRPELPEALDAVVRRALAKQPADRYQTAEQLHAALSAFDVQTPTHGVAVPPRRVTARRRWIAGAAISTVAVLIGALVWLRPSPAPASRAALRVVVAPFDDQGEGLRGFADQLTVQLTDAMLAVPALSVTPSAYVTPLHGASLDSLVARFHPDVLILGRIQPAAKDSVRLSVQVADPANRRALSTDDAIIVARSDSAVGASVQQLSASVRGALWKEIDREQRRARIRDPRAWADVEKARGFVDVGMEALQFRLDQRGFYSLAVADSLLQVAEQRDPSADLIPVERAYLAERRSFIAEWLEQNGRRLPAEVPRVDDERSRALGILNPLIRSHHGPADAFEVRGLVKRGLYRTLHQDSLLTAAIADFRAATELDLHRATAWKELAMAQSEAGLFTDALLSVTSALREDVFELHRVTLLRGRFDAAIRDGNIEVAAEACAAWLRIAPAYMRGFDCELLLWSRTRGDRRTVQLARARADSIRAAGDSVGLVPLMRSLYVAEIMARSGLADSADATARRATGADPARWGGLLVTEFAYYKLLRGDRDGAVALIVGVAERDPTIRHELSAVVWWQPLRSDPRVAALIKGATSPVPSTAP